jgi:hypothetical protein
MSPNHQIFLMLFKIVARCKNTTSVWVNGVRRVDGVDVDTIDYYDGTKQNGNILVTCNDGKLKPDIFSGQKIWCRGVLKFNLEFIVFEIFTVDPNCQLSFR